MERRILTLPNHCSCSSKNIYRYRSAEIWKAQPYLWSVNKNITILEEGLLPATRNHHHSSGDLENRNIYNIPFLRKPGSEGPF